MEATKAVVLLELDSIFASKEEQSTALKAVNGGKDV